MRIAATVLPVCALLSVLAWAQSAPAPMPADMQRISGTVEKWDGQNLLIKTADGEVRVQVPADARINTRRKGTMADIKPGSFVGSGAVTTSGGHLHANEVHIFPDSMRGTGEGHRDMQAPNTTMTNGNVASMTNGNVAAAAGGAQGSTITVTYAGGQQLIDVDSSTPISIISPVERTQVTSGMQVNAMGRKNSDGSLNAQMLEVVSQP